VLIFPVGQGLGRCHGDRIAGMNPHGIEIFDGTDDDHIVQAVAHDFELEFLPPEDRFFEHHGVDKTGIETALGEAEEIFPVIGHSPSRAAQGERRADDDGIADGLGNRFHLRQGVGNAAGGDAQADLLHCLSKQLAVFGLLDHGDAGPDQFHPVAFQNAHVGNPHGHVQGGLAAESRQDRLGALASDHLGHGFRSDGLNVGTIGRLGVRHDGGRVAVDEHNFVALLAECFAGLGARIVKFARLADDDGPRANNEDLPEVGPSGHECWFLATGSSSSGR